ncbi:MAG: hypothetical protein AB7S26_00885 [Sandaracinaceae bacterium]
MRTGWLALAVLVVACGEDPVLPLLDGGPEGGIDGGLQRVSAHRVWESSDTSCLYASTQLVRSRGEDLLLAIGIAGELRLLDPSTGEDVWVDQIEPPAAPDADTVVAISTPAIVHERYVVMGYADLTASPYTVRGFYVSVFDLETRTMSEDFERIVVDASVPEYAGTGNVVFDRRRQVQRGALRHIDVPDRELGLVYVAFGNGPSVQPFHGWMFELDLDAWLSGGADDAVTGTLLTTQENDCGAFGSASPSRCGGGLWNAAGPEIVPGEDGDYEIFVASGNGRVDFDVGAYAHSVLRTGRGLAFDRACDEALCAPFDELDPARECLESCENIFVPRLEVGEAPLAPSEGTCDGLTFFECYGAIDADLGANGPAIAEVQGGPRVVVQAGKDGALYLADADHLGRMYQRLQVMDFCGTPESPCEAPWIGMFVTHPVVTTLDGDPIVILASQMADLVHPSGITAVRVAMEDGEPRMRIHWQVPGFDTEDALHSFRYHPQRPVLIEVDGEELVVVVETRRDFYRTVTGIEPPGRIWGVRVADGALAFREDLSGAGQRFAIPAVVGDHIYVNSCDGRAEEEGRVDAFQIVSEY